MMPGGGVAGVVQERVASAKGSGGGRSVVSLDSQPVRL